ncbi:MAG: CoA transferase [Dehalococcoidia bacterium]
MTTQADDAHGPLAGIRVLDLSGELAVLGPRLLAALGADVVRPEPPAGDVLRHRAPFAPRRHGGEGLVSLAHIVQNGGKRSIVVPADEAGERRIRELAAAADVVILAADSLYRAAIGPPEAFSAAHPGCALVAVEPFPQASEYRGWQFTDLILSAASGFSWYCGLADGPPEHPKGQLAYSYSGLASAFAAMVGVTARRRTGRAGWFEFSSQEASAFSTLQSSDANQYRWYNDIPGRLQWTGTARRSLHQCADGRWVTFVMLGPHLDALAAWLSEKGLGDQFLGEQWAEREYYLAHAGELTSAIARLCSLYPRDELVARGQSVRLMVLPVSTATDLLDDPHLRERRLFSPVASEAGDLLLPRAPTLFSVTQPGPPRPAPRPGEHDIAVRRDWGARPAEPMQALPASPGLPLAGLRVADFSWQLAGPLATRLLGDMGADIVRIESHNRRDMVREVGPQPPGVFSLDTNSTHHNTSSNKRSIALDLHHPEAVAIAREIISRSDIVFDNFTPHAMAKWGFDAASLLREWPHLIVVSQPAVSCSGPHSHWGAIGTGVAGYAGLNGLSGFAENPPFGLGPIVADVIAPFFTMTSVLAALRHRDLTGEGQFIDGGMVESNVWMLDTALAEAQVTGADPARTGNRSAWMAPHGFFPCAGEDEWVAIAVRDDAEWQAATEALALEAAAADSRFASFAGRKGNEDELEALIATATRKRNRWDVAQELQAAGVPAAALENVADHLERDPGMADRFTPTPHPWGYEFLVQSQFIRPEGRTVPNRRAAMLGEQTHEILSGLLGKSETEIEGLVLTGALQ